MIPIWAKDREGKWRVLPQHLFKTFSDGEVGLTDKAYGLVLAGSYAGADDLFSTWGHVLVYDAVNCRTLLKRQLMNE